MRRNAVPFLVAACLAIAGAPVAQGSQNLTTSPCALQGASGNAYMTSGVNRIENRVPSTGSVSAVVIGVDFPQFRASQSPKGLFRETFKSLTRYFAEQSNGRLNLQIAIAPEWINLKKNPSEFKLGTSNPLNTEYTKALLAASAEKVELTKYQLVYFLIPRSVPISEIARGSAMLNTFDIPGGTLSNIVLAGGDLNFQIANGFDDKEVTYLAHETGHTLGLFDEDLNHQSQTLGPWSVMANIWDDGLTSFTSWDRFILGWLAPSDYLCMDSGLFGKGLLSRINLDPRNNAESPQAAFIRLSHEKILVIEALNAKPSQNPRSRAEQILTFVVDTSKGQAEGGYQVVPRENFQDPDFSDASLIRGERAKTGGMTIHFKDTRKGILNVSLQKY